MFFFPHPRGQMFTLKSGASKRSKGEFCCQMLFHLFFLFCKSLLSMKFHSTWNVSSPPSGPQATHTESTATPITENSNHQSFVIKPLKLPPLVLYLCSLEGEWAHFFSQGRRRGKKMKKRRCCQTLKPGAEERTQLSHCAEHPSQKNRIINLSVSKWRGSEDRSLLGDPGKLKGMNRRRGLQTKPPWEQTDWVLVERSKIKIKKSFSFKDVLLLGELQETHQ